MKLFIAEDEPPARERLLEAIGRVAPGSVVVGQSDSVRGTAQWLAQHPPPDLLLLDIQLADGLSLELFADATLELPVIFTTAYDRFALEAFQALAVDYLLKPIADAALAQALAKAQRLRAHFGADVARWLSPATTPATAPAARPWRQRVFGRAIGSGAVPLRGASMATADGAPFHALAVTQLACLVSVDKLAVAVALDGSRWRGCAWRPTSSSVRTAPRPGSPAATAGLSDSAPWWRQGPAAAPRGG